MESDHETVINSPQKIDNNEKVILKDTKYYNRRHVFANVRIIPGPNHPSSEEINCSNDGKNFFLNLLHLQRHIPDSFFTQAIGQKKRHSYKSLFAP